MFDRLKDKIKRRFVRTLGTRYGCLFTLTVLKVFNDTLNVAINDSLLTSSALQIL